jgi:hypothetical protein
MTQALDAHMNNKKKKTALCLRGFAVVNNKDTKK